MRFCERHRFTAVGTRLLARAGGVLSPTQGDAALAVRSACIYATTVLKHPNTSHQHRKATGVVVSVPFLSLSVCVCGVSALSVTL